MKKYKKFKNNNSLKIAINILGSQNKLAKKCCVSQQSVFKWTKNGVPPKRVLSIEKATSGKVTRYELRPDIYPRD